MLAVLKFVVGWIAASAALTADGFNSAGDIFATAVGVVGYTYAKKPPDEDHHYGHGNAESVAGLIIGSVLAGTGVLICLEGILALIAAGNGAPDQPALWVAGFTVIVKEALYRYASRIGRRLNSASLLASARDHRGDVLVGLTVFAGVLGARLGMPMLDPIAAICVGIYIAWFAVEPIRTNVGVLMDQAPPTMRNAIRRVVVANAEVRDVDTIRVHPIGAQFMIDLEIYLDDNLSLREAHEVAHRVSDSVAAEVPNVQDVNVHVNPGHGNSTQSPP